MAIICIEAGLQASGGGCESAVRYAKVWFRPQALLVEVGGPFMKTTGLTVAHWFVTLGLAALTFPLGWIMRQIPVPSKPSDFATYFQDDFAVRASVSRCTPLTVPEAGRGFSGIMHRQA